jgi:hypothetical protein
MGRWRDIFLHSYLAEISKIMVVGFYPENQYNLINP